MCPATIGSQTVGSISRPAAYTGIAALMPTQRRISRAGSFPDAWSLDHVGPLARSVADIVALTAAMSDSPIGAAPLPQPLRIGALGGFFLDNATEESRKHYGELIAKLTQAGFEVSEPRLPEIFSMGPAVLRAILRAEIAAAHEPLFLKNRESYGPKIRAMIETGLLLDASDYLRARRIRRIYQREMEQLFERVDVLMTPGARGTAPEGMATGDSVMQLPWALADFPTLSLPSAVASDGLPLGVQIIAAPMREAMLFAAGQAIESVIAFRLKPEI
jgi:Asp-tRNA(Asn)/Glu-tRNA(Gln) amidotransferase A subunit family amidase